MATIKSISSKSSIGKIVKYVTNKNKTNDELITGINCSPENVNAEMNYTKTHYHKKEGIQYFHVIQSFRSGELDGKKAHEIGKELANNIAAYHESLVVTHIDKKHIHNHIVINSVSFKDGKKYQVERGAYKIKKESDKICVRENLSVLENKRENQKNKNLVKVKNMSSNEYRAAINKDTTWWKGQVIIDIRQSQLKSQTKEDFIKEMEGKGYKVNWSDNRKYITYTTPDGKKIRDNKLHEEKLLKEVMERGFRQVTREQYDRATKSNVSGITRATEPGVIASATNRVIERSKQKLSGAENGFSKSSGTDLYTELSKQGTIKGNVNINRESDGVARTAIEEPGGTGRELQKRSNRSNSTDGQIFEAFSKGSSTRGIQEYAEAREVKPNIDGQSNNNDDRSISNSDNMLTNNHDNNNFKEIDKKKDVDLER